MLSLLLLYKITFPYFLNITEFYYQAGISAEEYQQELEYQLRKTTLGISVGLVKEFDGHSNHEEDNSFSKNSRYFNPYSHFARNANDERSIVEKKHSHPSNNLDENIHEYKICEIRPPSIEKVVMIKNTTIIFILQYVVIKSNMITIVYVVIKFLLRAQFLDSNGRTLDISAPPVTLPGNARAPFDSRNTAFNKDTFWSLLLLQPEATFDDRG